MRLYKTDDLALAAYLDVQGQTYQDLESRGNGRAVWVFRWCDVLEGHVDLYEGGAASVEPRSFMRSVSLVRNGLYAFLDGGS